MITSFEILQVITGCIGSLGFGILFNIRGKRLLFAALGGFLAWALFVVFSRFISNDPVNYFIVSLLVSLYAEVMARVMKTPTTTFITTALIPLIPGGSLYYTMASAFEASGEFVQRAVATLMLAAALALGTIVATALTKLFYKVLAKWGRKV
jgi:uncharacterized membrane protein YjjB (DUF3815 family)